MNTPHRKSGRNSELVDVSLQILSETEKAYLVTEGLRKENKLIQHWVPKSAVDGEDLEDRYPKVVVMTMPRWLFEEKGFTSDD